MKGKKMLVGILCAAAVLLPSAPQAKTARNGAFYVSRAVENLPAFKGVEVRGDAEVEFVQNAKTAVNVSGRENLVGMTQVRVENGTLVISFDEPAFGRGKDRLRVLVSAPELSSVTVGQSGEFEVRGALKAEELSLSASQNGDISIDGLSASSLSVTAGDRAEVDVNRMQVSRVRAAVSKLAEIDLSGSAEEAYLESNGSGEVDADGLRAETVTAVVNGNGKIKVFGLRTLNATVNGRGRIEYQGEPAELNRSGNLRKIVQDFDD